MNEHVCGKRRRALKGLAALFTLERSFVRVNVLVLFEADGVTERFTAHVTSKWAPSRVRTPHVHFQTVWRAEHFFAVQTIKRLTIVRLLRLPLLVCSRLGRSTQSWLQCFVRLICNACEWVRKSVSKKGGLPVRVRKPTVRYERLGRETNERRQAKKWVEYIRHKLAWKTREIRSAT